MARFLNSENLLDRVSTKDLLGTLNMLSINQLNAKIKLVEVWKALNVVGYPLKISRQEVRNDATNTRACARGRPIEIGISTLTSNTCSHMLVLDKTCVE